MCGIMGIINKKGNAIKKVIEGLEKLETVDMILVVLLILLLRK